MNLTIANEAQLEPEPAHTGKIVLITDYIHLVTNLGKPNEDWTPAIQAAIGDMKAGEVVFPKGTYLIALRKEKT